MKWERVRPGLYHLSVDGVHKALVERGAETGMWWWRREPNQCGVARTLRQAKIEAQQYV